MLRCPSRGRRPLRAPGGECGRCVPRGVRRLRGLPLTLGLDRVPSLQPAARVVCAGLSEEDRKDACFGQSNDS